jgi:glycosyltransferase involved in cell wall biosynthesis
MMQQRAAISVATYRRPDGLARLLDSIVEAEIPAGWDIVVVVVDNDADESAAATVGRYRNTLSRASHLRVTPELPPQSALAPAASYSSTTTNESARRGLSNCSLRASASVHR